ncbi:MAG: diaminopimelate dehydrogenase [Solobacterium sp.]|nr:diaminopimelate dehydrogenase [Solobacterium sp.]
MKIGIYGYGNLGRGVETAIKANADMELAAVFTRRNPEGLKINTEGVPVVSAAEVKEWKDKIDVLVICGGSATDLPEMTPALVKDFNVIDSYDNHSSIPAHYAKVNEAAEESGHVAVISCGWDPGLFSVARIYANSTLPNGKDYTFWGRGVSQGHSDAIRRIPGVLDARQYTVPVEASLAKVRNGENPELTTREKHTRECYVVAEEGADLKAIEEAIVTMPAYFEPYDTTVHFISMEELKTSHAGLPHGGSVIRTGETSEGVKQVIEFKLDLDSNPEFTGSVLVAYARAVSRMAARGETGCRTVLDIAPKDIYAGTYEELLAHML